MAGPLPPPLRLNGTAIKKITFFAASLREHVIKENVQQGVGNQCKI